MSEQLFLRRQQAFTAPPPVPNANCTRIQINWKREVVKTIKIQHHRTAMATKARNIHLKPDCVQGHDVQVAPHTQAQMILPAEQSRSRC